MPKDGQSLLKKYNVEVSKRSFYQATLSTAVGFFCVSDNIFVCVIPHQLGNFPQLQSMSQRFRLVGDDLPLDDQGVPKWFVYAIRFLSSQDCDRSTRLDIAAEQVCQAWTNWLFMLVYFPCTFCILCFFFSTPGVGFKQKRRVCTVQTSPLSKFTEISKETD